MAKSTNRPTRARKRSRGKNAPTEAVGRAGARRQPGQASRTSTLITSKRPIVRFVVLVVALLCMFNYVYYVAFVKHDLIRPHLENTAQLTGMILSMLGEDVHVDGTSVTSSRFPMEIDPGCDALQAVAFFVVAVIAAPLRVSLPLKIASILLGTVFLTCANLVRISSLYYVGAYWPGAFETLHIDVWQTLFIFLPIFLWLVWAWWAIRRFAGAINVCD